MIFGDGVIALGNLACILTARRSELDCNFFDLVGHGYAANLLARRSLNFGIR
jgi:hypothetical protein